MRFRYFIELNRYSESVYFCSRSCAEIASNCEHIWQDIYSRSLWSPVALGGRINRFVSNISKKWKTVGQLSLEILGNLGGVDIRAVNNRKAAVLAVEGNIEICATQQNSFRTLFDKSSASGNE